MVRYEFLHGIWMVEEQIFVFSISHCSLDAKLCRTFGLVIFNFLPDRHRFSRSGLTVFRKD